MTENWKPVVGAENRYEVSDRGNVRSLPHVVIEGDGRRHPVKGRLLKPMIVTQRSGRNKPYRYRVVAIRFDGRAQDRKIVVLMLEAFVGPRPYPKAEARHLNDQSLDDRLENLEWGSRLQNVRDAALNGRLPNNQGSTNGYAILAEADVVSIRAAYASGGVLQRELAEQYGVARSTIGNIVTGRRWRHVQRPGLTGVGVLTAEVEKRD
jgi:hypothetical protein